MKIIIFRAILLSFLLSLSVAWGQGAAKYGRVEIVDALKSPIKYKNIDCIDDYSCQIILFNEKPLLWDAYITINKIISNKGEIEILFINTSTGGNACCSREYLIDFSGIKPIIVSDAPIVDEAALIENYDKGVIFQGITQGKGTLGEDLVGTYRYTFGSGKIQPLRFLPKYVDSEMAKKEYPSELFDDPVRRLPLLKLLGRSEFLQLRKKMGVESLLENSGNDVFIGQGCQPHSCGTSEGIFAINIKENQAWAMYVDDRKVKFFGSYQNLDNLLKSKLGGWLRINKFSWSDVVIIDSAYKKFSPQPVNGRNQIKLITELGILKVPVVVNGVVPLNFVIDSGASDVVIPSDVALVLMRTGTLQTSDFIGEKKYRLADGTFVVSKVFKLKSMQVGNRVVEDVVATISGADGMLLLGQSFLGKFKKWTVHNNKKELELE